MNAITFQHNGIDVSNTIGSQFDLDDYVPFYITAIANRWTAASSRKYLEAFAIGVVEWRVLAALAAKGAMRSLDIAKLTGVDTAAVSRAVGNLEKREFICAVAGRYAGRTRPMEMTATGKSLFENIQALAFEREQTLLADLDAADRATLLHLLRKLHAQLPNL
jgi:DNA-binding MarR family transcriptional regulator